MSFGEAVAVCLRNYAVLSGRARRAEYWWFVLFNLLVSMVATFIDNAVSSDRQSDDPWGTGPIATIVSLALMLPGIGVSVRRLHDTDRSGWWLLGVVLLFPACLMVMVIAMAANRQMHSPAAMLVVSGLLLLVGLAAVVVFVVWYATDGTPGPNRYGRDPKGRVAERRSS